MDWIGNFKGEIAGLGAALIWAVASSIYVGLGKQMPPLILNFTKSGIAIGFILLTLLLRGDVPQMSGMAVLLLGLSGAIGIGLGDTAFFASLNVLGARRALLFEALSPAMTAILAGIFLDELLGLQTWIGIILTVVGVAWVVVERTPDQPLDRSHLWLGIGYGFLAALGQAGGAVLSRAALAGTTVSPLWSTLIRLVAGVLFLLVWMLIKRQSLRVFEPLRSPRFLMILAATAFCGTYLAIWLQQTALKFTAAGIAQALTSTSPLFVIPIALWAGERVSMRAILGAIIALGGIWLLFGITG
ncbi:DMT family transporter [Leptolyngbya ohadii]|uniref:DMT family transporter n=1 Tax=Leptolyngbya ohadii TaxID=1962290 RepID=UPI0021F0DBD9|nr:DMT family transporter [Leptolyngbya ohadii]